MASEDQVEIEEINSLELRKSLEAFPRLASRFYLSLATLLARRLRQTSRELAKEITLRDRR